jgi:hypothetical protein
MKAIVPLAFAVTIALVAQALAATNGLIRSDAPSSILAYDRVPLATERLQGIVAAIDERNDQVTLRLPSNETTDLKVADGLLFNALRYGDVVNVTIRTVSGVKTIVDLDKE